MGLRSSLRLHIAHRYVSRLLALWPWAVVTALVLPATWYLWYPGLQATYDGFYHKSRFFELDVLLRAGVVYPRWLPHLNFAYGSPTLHFYSPLIYHIAEAFRLLGWGYLRSYEWMIGVGIVAAGWGMYALARRWGHVAGWMAAVVYVYWPYHLELAYIRGAQAELWGMVWYPFIVHALMRLVEGGKAWVGLPVLFATLILTHHLSAFSFALLIAAYLFVQALVERRSRPLRKAGIPLLLGVGLAALYWLPVLADIDLVWAGRPLEERMAGLLGALVSPSELLSPFWVHRYAPDTGVQAPSPLPRLIMLLWGTSVAVILARRRMLSRHKRVHALFFIGSALVAAFMFTVYSRPLWAHLPLLHFLQFPWRLHSVMGFSVAVVVGIAVGTACQGAVGRFRYPGQEVALVALTGALAFVALAHIPYNMANEPLSQRPLREEDVDLRLMAAYDYLRGLFIRELHDSWVFEYMPVWSAPARTEYFVPPEQPPPNAPPLSVSLRLGPQTPLDRIFFVESPHPWTFSLHQFYFPAWRLWVDGRPITPRPEGVLGLLAGEVPAGKHTLRVAYRGTGSQRVGEVISLVAFLAWGGVALRRRSRWLAVPLAIGIYLLVATAPAWWRGGAVIPREQNVLLGDRIRLVGSYIPRRQVAQGERAWFALYWFVLAPPQQRYKVIVHLTDGQGNTVANGDTEPWFYFTPTTRWQQGELMEDWYFVDVPPDLPPGRYLLLTGMYDPKTVKNLPVQGGRMVGGRVLVGEIEVEGR